MVPKISADVAGYADRNNDRYIHLARNYAVLMAQPDPVTPASVSPLRLIDASAPLKSWHLNSNGTATLLFEHRGELTLGVPASCMLSTGGTMMPSLRQGPYSVFTVPAEKAAGEFTLEC
jgi:hypothetical protein